MLLFIIYADFKWQSVIFTQYENFHDAHPANENAFYFRGCVLEK